jgi:cyclopropane fatty-acyl-phospholipid synthase-like methyltransferase
MTTRPVEKAAVAGACRRSDSGARGLGQRVVAQFEHPHGLLGRVAGLIMARRRSNVARSEWTISLLDVQPTDRVLEIGFGPGVAVVRAARRRNAEAVGRGQVDLRLASVSSLPSFDELFDKILSVNSVQFWDEPESALAELRERLRPRGRIALCLQPRARGATDEDARRMGEQICGWLERAGFRAVHLESLPMKPVCAVCALASR